MSRRILRLPEAIHRVSLYQFLGSKPASELSWQNIHLWWGDERCVSPDHIDSNYRMVRESLLDHINIAAKNVHRILGESRPESEARRYGEELVRNLPSSDTGVPVFDLILLGIGEDGHTASIFPDSDLNENDNSYCAVSENPGIAHKRITMTMPVLNHAKRVMFMVSGTSKADVVDQILNQKEKGKFLPASRVKPVNGDIIWFLDRNAAARLKS